jgi:glucose/arabinose dehydrogenase
MKTLRKGSKNLRAIGFGGLALVCAGMALAGQNNSYPDPNNLPAPGSPSPPPKKTNFVQKPANATLRVPQGFSVTLLQEGLPNGARSIVTAPNGDLFIGGYTSNTVMVLRDGSKDGRYNTKFVYLPTGRAAPGNPTTGGITRGTGTPVDDRGGGNRGRTGGNNFAAQSAGGSGGRATAPAPQAPARATAQTEGPNPMAIDPATGLPRGDKASRDRALPCRKDVPATVGSTTLRQAFGMAFNGDYLYVANTDSVIRYKYTAGDTQAQ